MSESGESVVYEIELENVDGLSEDEMAEAAAIVALQQLRRRKLYGTEQLVDLTSTQRMIEESLDIYGCGLEPVIDAGPDWRPEEP